MRSLCPIGWVPYWVGECVCKWCEINFPRLCHEMQSLHHEKECTLHRKIGPNVQAQLHRSRINVSSHRCFPRGPLWRFPPQYTLVSVCVRIALENVSRTERFACAWRRVHTHVHQLDGVELTHIFECTTVFALIRSSKLRGHVIFPLCSHVPSKIVHSNVLFVLGLRFLRISSSKLT